MSFLKRISVRIFGPSQRANRSPQSAPSESITPRRNPGEAGYTMLFAVFLVATMLISLTTLSLNIVTQGQREKEEEMVWRGHQYERGIRRYVAKFGRYPTKVDDMVKATSGVRYMREAYKDPMNKEDGSWRFIYVTPAGQLIGSVRYTSLVQMALMDKMQQMGGAAMAGMNGMPGVNGMPGGMQGSSPFGNSQPFGGSSGFGSPGGFGTQGSGSPFSQPGGNPNGGNSGTNPNSGQQRNPNGNGNQDNSGVNSGNTTGNQNGTGTGSGLGTQPGQTQPGGGNSSAFGFSNGQQQSGSAFGFGNDNSSSPLGQMGVIGGSITGVGSKIERSSLKIYKGGKKYKEWEFIYNPIEQQQQQAAGAMGGGGVVGNPANNNGSSFGNPGGMGGLGSGNGNGGNSPFSPTPNPPELPPNNPQPRNP